MAYRFPKTAEYTLIVRQDGTVDVLGVELGGRLVLHDVYDVARGVVRLVVKSPSHRRFGGTGVGQISEPGRLLDFEGTLTEAGAKGGLAFHVKQVGSTYIRPFVEPSRLAEILKEMSS